MIPVKATSTADFNVKLDELTSAKTGRMLFDKTNGRITPNNEKTFFEGWVSEKFLHITSGDVLAIMPEAGQLTADECVSMLNALADKLAKPEEDMKIEHTYKSLGKPEGHNHVSVPVYFEEPTKRNYAWNDLRLGGKYDLIKNPDFQTKLIEYLEKANNCSANVKLTQQAVAYIAQAKTPTYGGLFQSSFKNMLIQAGARLMELSNFTKSKEDTPLMQVVNHERNPHQKPGHRTNTWHAIQRALGLETYFGYSKSPK